MNQKERKRITAWLLAFVMVLSVVMVPGGVTLAAESDGAWEIMEAHYDWGSGKVEEHWEGWQTEARQPVKETYEYEFRKGEALYTGDAFKVYEASEDQDVWTIGKEVSKALYRIEPWSDTFWEDGEEKTITREGLYRVGFFASGNYAITIDGNTEQFVVIRVEVPELLFCSEKVSKGDEAYLPEYYYTDTERTFYLIFPQKREDGERVITYSLNRLEDEWNDNAPVYQDGKLLETDRITKVEQVDGAEGTTVYRITISDSFHDSMKLCAVLSSSDENEDWRTGIEIRPDEQGLNWSVGLVPDGIVARRSVKAAWYRLKQGDGSWGEWKQLRRTSEDSDVEKKVYNMGPEFMLMEPLKAGDQYAIRLELSDGFRLMDTFTDNYLGGNFGMWSSLPKKMEDISKALVSEEGCVLTFDPNTASWENNEKPEQVSSVLIEYGVEGSGFFAAEAGNGNAFQKTEAMSYRLQTEDGSFGEWKECRALITDKLTSGQKFAFRIRVPENTEFDKSSIRMCYYVEPFETNKKVVWGEEGQISPEEILEVIKGLTSEDGYVFTYEPEKYGMTEASGMLFTFSLIDNSFPSKVKLYGLVGAPDKETGKETVQATMDLPFDEFEFNGNTVFAFLKDAADQSVLEMGGYTSNQRNEMTIVPGKTADVIEAVYIKAGRADAADFTDADKREPRSEGEYFPELDPAEAYTIFVRVKEARPDEPTTEDPAGAEADRRAAEAVIAMIERLPEKLTEENEAEYREAERAYLALTDAQKAYVSADVLNKIYSQYEGEVPTTQTPGTEAPTTQASVTEAPTTQALATEAPKTEAPTTQAPVTEAPTTQVPVTEQPAEVGAKVTDSSSTAAATYTVIQKAAVGESGSVTYTGDNGNAATVTIPETIRGTDGVTYQVTRVDSNAMKGNTSVKTVTISDTVEEIGSGAFQNATSLTTVKLGTGVTTIGKNSFAGCTSLKKVTVKSKSVKTVAEAAFKGTTKLAAVDLSASKVTTIGKNAFNGDKQLKTIKINGNSLKKVGKNAFKGIKKNATITIAAKDKKTYSKVVKMIQKSGAKNVKFKYKNKK